jgi:uncharacterized membrane protein YcaP (DUF421 family)
VSEIWTLDVPAAEKVLRTVAVYAALALLLRVAGKRNLAHLNTFDLVVVLLLSTVVQNALIGPDDSVTGGLLAAALLVAANAVVIRVLSRSERAVRLFEGADVPLIRDGRFLDRFLRREGLRQADVEAALRAQGADGAGDVADASLSPGGSIVVWLKPSRRSATHGDIDALHRRLDALHQAIEAIVRRDTAQERGELREAGLGVAGYDVGRLHPEQVQAEVADAVEDSVERGGVYADPGERGAPLLDPRETQRLERGGEALGEDPADRDPVEPLGHAARVLRRHPGGIHPAPISPG